MNLKFNPEAKVTEWMHGSKYFKNEGGVIDVTPSEAKAMLRHMHEVSPRQFVPVFELAENQAKVNKAERSAMGSEYPSDFPHADLLIKAGFGFDAVKALKKENLIEVEGIGPAKADAILAAL